MYLTSEVKDIGEKKRNFVAEELYKLNEAIFNLPEEDNVDSQTGSKVFAFS